MTTKELIAAFERAARANRLDPWRDGNLIRLPATGSVIMTGDLHGHELNYERLCRAADLAVHRDRHLILHEILHSANTRSPDQCDSYLLLAKAAQLKVEYPGQVHFLLSNHEIAQVTRDEILKAGQAMVRAVTNSIATTFAEKSPLVMQALDDFILSMPLAVRTENRIWMSHSLPSMRHWKTFDERIFSRKLTRLDLQNDASLRSLTWDRQQAEAGLEQMARRWQVDHFIVGHQPQSHGCDRRHGRLIVLASDHAHGCYLPFFLDKNYAPEELFGLIKPLASIQ
ncbi:MAG: hypothetical protein JW810_09775 [Sedimentisphaerales bacterium]|nr:hypothetical protein [Sedimentisphaerales bacterium]